MIMSRQPFDEVALQSRQLKHEGDSTRTLCPFCLGGRSKEESFVLRKINSIVFGKCYRASCGRVWANGGHTILPSTKKKARWEFTAGTFPPSDGLREWLWKKYQLSDAMIDYYGIQEVEDGWYAVPTFAISGIRNGWVVRARKPKSPREKVKTFVPEGELGSWYNRMPEIDDVISPYISTTLVVVEDVISAMRAHLAFHSVALMGSFITPSMAQLLAVSGYKHILLALDPDATESSIRQVRKYKGIVPNFNYIPLQKDIKDMDDREFEQLRERLLLITREVE